MTQAKNHVDKNLSNVVNRLEEVAVNSHHAQQLQQDHDDRRHQDELNHDSPTSDSR
ncbi:hypothetical protein [Paenibacillus arenosi]|uniref:Uncharacterized protein n=1 Tax=Paenibacillus arenosi TaxID=2774142 RepID=A0ABR9B2A4_9BACL|nr:hypothetical protein [Paenibacillus arenosi]MBD8500505.1 hypothetical protein [Paenibacillus arenosi]